MSKQIDFYQISLKLILLNDEDKILALKAVSNGTFAGFYDLPGGRIDTDEFSTSFADILNRELKEEIGDVIVNIEPNIVASGRKIILAEHTKSKDKDIHVLYLFFQGRYQGGEIKISTEHNDYTWLDLNNIDLNKYFKEGLLDGLVEYLNQ